MKNRILAATLVIIQMSVCVLGQEPDAGSINSPQVEYYAVIMDGAKVGYATNSRTVSGGPASPDSGLASRGGQVKTTDTMDITISRFGIPVSLKTTETCIETAKGEPMGFNSVQDVGLMIMRTQGTVGKDGIVQVRTSGTSAGQDSNFPWPAGALMSEGLRLLVMEKGLKEGAGYNVKIFSPSMMDAIDSRVNVGAKQQTDLFGRIVTLTKVETVMSMPGTGEMTTVSYVDDDFRALKSATPMMGMQLELVACEKEAAMGGNEVFDMGDGMFLASPEPIEDVKSAKAIAYGLKPTGQGDFTIPSSDNQRVKKLEDGSMIVVVEPASVSKGDRFPYKGTDANIIEATKPSRFLQSDDPKIIELAKRAIGGAKDSLEAARRIEAFVGNYVTTKSMSVGYASASEVAISRQGDCSEFAVLCAAMCRSAGIPARVVVGVAYVDDFMGRSGFGGHAWVEVYAGGKWVGLDPMFKSSGRGGFDAGHIALAWGNGEPVKFFNIATTLGRFRIEKVMVNRKERY